MSTFRRPKRRIANALAAIPLLVAILSIAGPATADSGLPGVTLRDDDNVTLGMPAVLDVRDVPTDAPPMTQMPRNAVDLDLLGNDDLPGGVDAYDIKVNVDPASYGDAAQPPAFDPMTGQVLVTGLRGQDSNGHPVERDLSMTYSACLKGTSECSYPATAVLHYTDTGPVVGSDPVRPPTAQLSGAGQWTGSNGLTMSPSMEQAANSLCVDTDHCWTSLLEALRAGNAASISLNLRFPGVGPDDRLAIASAYGPWQPSPSGGTYTARFDPGTGVLTLAFPPATTPVDLGGRPTAWSSDDICGPSTIFNVIANLPPLTVLSDTRTTAAIPLGTFGDQHVAPMSGCNPYADAQPDEAFTAPGEPVKVSVLDNDMFLDDAAITPVDIPTDVNVAVGEDNQIIVTAPPSMAGQDVTFGYRLVARASLSGKTAEASARVVVHISASPALTPPTALDDRVTIQEGGRSATVMAVLDNDVTAYDRAAFRAELGSLNLPSGVSATLVGNEVKVAVAKGSSATTADVPYTAVDEGGRSSAVLHVVIEHAPPRTHTGGAFRPLTISNTPVTSDTGVASPSSTVRLVPPGSGPKASPQASGDGHAVVASPAGKHETDALEWRLSLAVLVGLTAFLVIALRRQAITR